jgi:hypothetical protein
MPGISKTITRRNVAETSAREVDPLGVETRYSTGPSDQGVATTSQISRGWTNTPNFKTMRRLKQLPENNLSLDKLRQGSTAVFLQGSGRSSTGPIRELENRWWYGSLIPPAAFPSIPALTISDSSLNNRLIKKAKSFQTNLPVFLAEGRKTSDMVYQRANQLVRMARHLKSGRFGDFVKELAVKPTSAKFNRGLGKYNKEFHHSPAKAAGNAWLEFQYGWTPFMLEVQAATNQLIDITQETVSRYGRLVVTEHNAYQEEQTNVGLAYPGGMGNVTYTYTESRKAYWVYEIKPQDIPGRFGLLNPLEVVYELVPFSFVADWFVPIGDYIQALDAPLRFNHVKGSRSSRQEMVVEWSLTHLAAGSGLGDLGRSAGGSGWGRNLRVRRDIMTSQPSVGTDILRFDSQLNSNRILSSIALLHQQLSRFAR